MKKQSPAYVIGFMVVICVVFGLGVSLVHYATQGLLARNEQLHRDRVLCHAFGLEVRDGSADDYATAVAKHISSTNIVASNQRLWTVYKCDNEGLRSIGFEFSGMGFWGPMIGVVVLSPDLNAILNIQFLEQEETPGLGARIEEPWFTDQFKGLSIAWNKPEDERIVIGPYPDPDAKNRVDAITGATQTSMALMRSLNQELNGFRDLVEAHPDLEKYGEDHGV